MAGEDTITVPPGWRLPRWARIVAVAVGVALAARVALLVAQLPHRPASGLVATLPDPAKSPPDGLTFESNTVLVTTDDASHAYQWSIGAQSPATTSYPNLRLPDHQLTQPG